MPPAELYLDNNVMTKMSSDTMRTLLEWSQRHFSTTANHDGGVMSRRMLSMFQREISLQCGFELSEYSIFFTANTNLILSTISRYAARTNIMPHIIISAMDSPVLLEYANNLYKDKLCQLTILSVEKYGAEYGAVSIHSLETVIRRNTCLISIAGGSELGIINNMRGLSAVAKKFKIPFYSDMSRLIGRSIINPNSIGLAAFSISLQIIGGFPGINALVVKNQFVSGFGLTLSNTETNIPGIAASLSAFKVATTDMSKKNSMLKKYRTHIMATISSKVKCFDILAFPSDPISSIDGGITISAPRPPPDPEVKRAMASKLPVIFWISPRRNNESRVLPNTLTFAIYGEHKYIRLLEQKGIIVGEFDNVKTFIPTITEAMTIPKALRQSIIQIGLTDINTSEDIMRFINTFLDILMS